MSRLIDPVIADLQAEYGQTVVEGRIWRGRWVRLAGYVAFLKVFVASDWSLRDDAQPLLRTAGFALVATIVVTAVFEVIPLRPYWSGPTDRQTLIMSLIPQALTVSIPIGLTIGITLGLARQRVSARLAMSLAAAAAVVSIGSVSNVAWILPNSNQAFRVAVVEGLARQRGREDLLPVKLERNDTELTFSELGRRIQASARYPVGSYEWEQTIRFRLHYHTRWSLAFASLALTLFATALAASTRQRWVLGVGVVAVIIGYYITLYYGQSLVWESNLPPPVAAWLANVVTLAAAALFVVRVRLRSRAERIADGHAFHA